MTRETLLINLRVFRVAALKALFIIPLIEVLEVARIDLPSLDRAVKIVRDLAVGTDSVLTRRVRVLCVVCG